MIFRFFYFILFFNFISATMPLHAETMRFHRQHALNISEFYFSVKSIPDSFWPSKLTDKSEFRVLSNASDNEIFIIPDHVTSEYDDQFTHDVSHFYSGLKKTRVNLILNFPTNIYGQILSLGYDSGAKSEKARVNKGYFIGLSQSAAISNIESLSFSIGAWLSGRVSENPCLDSYDREYACRSLTAWSDFSQYSKKNWYYIDLKYKLIF
jgi:hypothetical protein